MGVLVAKELEIGSQFTVSLEQRDGVAPHLLYQVVRCRGPVVGGYAVGAEFVGVVSDAEVRGLRPNDAPRDAAKIAGALLS